MAGIINHIFTSPIADGTNTQLVRPSDWNSVHTYSGIQDGVSLSGNNTAGVLAAVSSGTLYLAGGNNVTLSQNGNSVTISGGAGSSLSFSNANGVSFGVAGSTLTASVQTAYQSQGAYLTTARASNDALGLATAQTNVTWTANSAGLSLNAGGYAGTGLTTATTAGTALVGTNNTSGLSLGVPAWLTAAAGAFSAGASNVGNTAGNTGITGTRLVFAGGNNITVSQGTDANGATLTISGANAGGAQTGISSVIASDATYTSGLISFSNQGNVTIGSSVNGATQYVRLSVAAQTNQSAIKAFGASNTGNTAGNTGVSTGVDWVLAATSGLTVSESTAVGGPNTLWLSVGSYITTGDLSANSSNYVAAWDILGNNTAGTTSSAQGTKLHFSAGNSLTLSGNSNTIVLSVGAYITTADLSANSSNYARNWKLTGNTAGTTSSAIGTDLWLAGGNGVTLSGNSNSITVSVGNYLTTAALSGDTSKYVQAWELEGANTAGTTSSAQGTKLYLSGGNNVTLSGNSNTVVFSAAAQTNQTLGWYATGNTLTNAGFSSSATFNATSVLFNFANGLSGGFVTLAGPLTQLRLSGPDPLTVGVSGNTTNDASTGVLRLQTLVFSALGAASMGISTANSALVVSVPVQTNQTEGIYLTGNTTADSSSRTVDARSLSISAAGAVSIGWNTAASQLVISGATAAVGTVSIYGAGNTTGTSSATVANVISLNAIGGAISVAASSSGWNLSVPQTSSLSATGWVQISTNGSTISVGATTTMNLYALGNTSGTSSGTADMRTVSLSGLAPVQVAASNSGWNVGLQPKSFFEPAPWNAANTATTSQGIGTLGLQPFVLEYPLSFGQINMIASAALSGTFAGSANTLSFSCGGASSFGFSATGAITNANSVNVVIFSKGTGSNTDMLFSVASTNFSIATAFANQMTLSVTGGAASVSGSLSSKMSVSVSFPGMTSGQAINGASSWTTWGVGYTNTNSSTSTSTSGVTSTSLAGGTSISAASVFPGNLSSFFQSFKLLPVPFATSLTPGEYWLGIWRMTASTSGITTANNNVGAAHSYSSTINWSAGTSTAQLTWAGSTNVLSSSLGWLGFASAATMAPAVGLGTFSATYATNSTYANAAGQPNGAIALSNVNTAVSFFQSWAQFASIRI